MLRRNRRVNRQMAIIENGLVLSIEGDEDDKSTDGGDTGGDDDKKDENKGEADKGDDGKGKEKDPAKAKADDKKDDGKKADDSKVNDELARLLKDVMKQKDRAKTALEEKTALEQQLSQVQGVLGDLSLDDVSGLIAARREEETHRLEEKGEYEAIVQQMKDQHKSAVSTMEEQINELKGKLTTVNGSLEELSVGRAFSDSSYLRDSSAIPNSIARKEFGTYFEMDGDRVVPYNKPRGLEDRAPLVDAEGNVKDFETAIKELYEKHPESKSLIKTSQKPGAGSKTDKVPSDTKSDKSTDTSGLSGVDKITAGLKQRAAS